MHKGAMMQGGLVSIMMPAYNARKYLGTAIDSVLAQTYRDWELLVVDDGSTDGTSDVASRYTDPRITLINKENGGESTARNAALERSRGEFIAYLDADDAYLPNHLEVTLKYLSGHPECDAVYTDGHHIDHEGRLLKSLSSRRRGPFEGRLFDKLVIASDVFGPPLCVVLRHELVARHTLRYDARIVIGPDWDFFMRYSELARFGYVPEATCLYRVHQSNITLQVGGGRRNASLALCRKKSIQLAAFRDCPLEARLAVFYDLLVNLLEGLPEEQEEITGWTEFRELPAEERARLCRLMASKAIAAGRVDGRIAEWLRRARELNPSDRRAKILDRLYRMSPRICRQVLRTKTGIEGGSERAAPFADLAQN